MRKSIWALAVLVAACAFTPAVASAAELSIKASEPGITFPHGVNIEGKLTGQPGGNGGQELELIGLPYPYKKEVLFARGKTTASGTYSIRALPGFNTRYFVRQASGDQTESKQILVYVDPTVSFSVELVGVNLIEAKAYLGWGPGLTTNFNNLVVWWYLAGRGDKFAKRLPEVSRTKLFAPGQILIKDRIRLRGIPQGARFSIHFCYTIPGKDVGIYKPGTPDCPKQRKRLAPNERL